MSAKTSKKAIRASVYADVLRANRDVILSEQSYHEAVARYWAAKLALLDKGEIIDDESVYLAIANNATAERARNDAWGEYHKQLQRLQGANSLEHESHPGSSADADS